jgi:DnaJ-class molecular chaperone
MSAEVANVQYYIRPGTGDGGTCHVRGEGSCDVGEEPGDIQVKISVQKHERYV